LLVTGEGLTDLTLRRKTHVCNEAVLDVMFLKIISFICRRSEGKEVC